MSIKVDEKSYENAGNPNVIKSIAKENAYILDIGCGAGDNARILESFGHKIDGITLSLSEQMKAEKFCREVIIHNLENGLPEKLKNNKYDYIICSHVLEHIAFPANLLKDIYELALKNKSKVIIMLPNIMYYKTRLKLIKGDFEYTHDGIMDYTHLRWYTLKSAKNLFQQYGFIVQVARVDGFLPFHSVVQKTGTNLYKFMKYLLYKSSPTFWGSELIFELHT